MLLKQPLIVGNDDVPTFLAKLNNLDSLFDNEPNEEALCDEFINARTLRYNNTSEVN